MSKRVHRHSLDAYHGFDRASREADVIRAFRGLGRATDRQVAEHLGHEDMNAVRPTITKLIELSIVSEIGSVQCAKTRRTVRVCTMSAAGVVRWMKVRKSVPIGPKSAAILEALRKDFPHVPAKTQVYRALVMLIAAKNNNK